MLFHDFASILGSDPELLSGSRIIVKVVSGSGLNHSGYTKNAIANHFLADADPDYTE